MEPVSHPRLYLIAGEVSGDLHGSSLVRALNRRFSCIEMRGMGGDRMNAAGVELAQHIEGVSFMGFVEVVQNLPTIWRLFRKIERDLLEFKPDALLLIDYPGFNLRMARFARKHGIPVVYYIAPQVWAWNAGRAHKIKRLIDLLLVILPFEPDFFAGYGVAAHFVGHPLLDVLPEPQDSVAPEALALKDERPLVLLLPGSRKQEVSRMLPVMLEVARRRPELQFALALAPNLKAEALELENAPSNLKIVQGKTYDLLRVADFALVTSGTATLETALLNVPQIVCYRASRVSYEIARRVIRVPYISLVNLILGREAVPELIQQEMNADRLAALLDEKLLDENQRKKTLADYDELRDRLKRRGASERAAELIAEFLAAK